MRHKWNDVGRGEVEYVVLKASNYNTNHLLTAAHTVAAIPPYLRGQPVMVFLKDFSEQELRELDHLLQILIEGGVKLELIFKSCSNINDPSMVPLLRHVPGCQTVTFDDNELEVHTIINIAGAMSSQRILLKSISFRSCSLDKNKLKHIKSQITQVEMVDLSGNDISMKWFKSLLNIINKMHALNIINNHNNQMHRDIPLKILEVDKLSFKSVKKLFREHPNIEISTQ